MAKETVEAEKKEPIIIIKEAPAPKVSLTEQKPKRPLRLGSVISQEEILQPKKALPPPQIAPIKLKPINRVQQQITKAQFSLNTIKLKKMIESRITQTSGLSKRPPPKQLEDQVTQTIDKQSAQSKKAQKVLADLATQTIEKQSTQSKKIPKAVLVDLAT